MSDLTEYLTCSVVIYDKKEVSIRLCKMKAYRMLEIRGETMFAFCKRHADRVRTALDITCDGEPNA